MIQTIYSILSLIRFKNIIIATLCVLLGAYILSYYNESRVLLCIIIIVSSMSFGNILNDIVDLENDEINHAERVLPKNKLSLQTAYYLAYICLCITIIASLYISQIAQISLLAIFFLLILYNFYLKSMVLIGNFIVAFLLSAVFIFTEMVLLGTYTNLIIPASLAFGLSLIREIIKDLEDMEGDKITHRVTLPIYVGINRAILIISGLIIIFNTFCLYLYFTHYNSTVYLISIIILVEMPLLVVLFLLINNPKKTTFSIVVNVVKYITISGLLVLFLANLG